MNRRPIAFAVIAFLGLLDSGYLAAKSLLGGPIPCIIGNGCDTVTTSVYGSFLGIPVSMFGALYYVVILVLAIAYLDTKKPELLRWIAKLTIVGLLASIYFMSVQAFILNAYCTYCIGSAITSTLLFIVALPYLRGRK